LHLLPVLQQYTVRNLPSAGLQKNQKGQGDKNSQAAFQNILIE